MFYLREIRPKRLRNKFVSLLKILKTANHDCNKGSGSKYILQNNIKFEKSSYVTNVSSYIYMLMAILSFTTKTT